MYKKVKGVSEQSQESEMTGNKPRFHSEHYISSTAFLGFRGLVNLFMPGGNISVGG